MGPSDLGKTIPASRVAKTLAVVLCAVTLCAPAYAWGPRTQLSIVTTAMRVMDKDRDIPLTRLRDDLQQGVLVGSSAFADLYPGASTQPLQAIQNEIALLRAVRNVAPLDGYYAFRLGSLGKLVVQTVSPLQTVSPAFSNVYFADVEGRIESVSFQSLPRLETPPEQYLRTLVAEAALNDEVILREYQGGIGFSGVAEATLPRLASLSLSGVINVWRAVFSSGSVQGGVSDAQIADYIVNATRFAVQKGNMGEVEATAQRFRAVAATNPDLQVELGDVYYEAGLADRAVETYLAVIEAQPDRKEVAERISQYFMDRGQAALADDELEGALDSFAQALDADPLHPTAEAERLRAARLIGERDARLGEARAAIDRGQQLQSEAERQALNGQFAEAIGSLRLARANYEQVTDEFPAEFNTSLRSRTSVDNSIRRYRDELMRNAQAFSGVAFSLDAQRMARERQNGLDRDALQISVSESYTEALQQLSIEVGADLNR